MRPGRSMCEESRTRSGISADSPITPATWGIPDSRQRPGITPRGRPRPPPFLPLRSPRWRMLHPSPTQSVSPSSPQSIYEYLQTNPGSTHTLVLCLIWPLHTAINKESDLTRRPHLLIATCVLTLMALWVMLPILRAALLLRTTSSGVPPPPAGLPVQNVTFHASDGVVLSGWLARRSPRTPTIIFIPGYKATRSSMLAYARLLWSADYNVLLYDSRGTGASGGGFSLGLPEANDVRGAIHCLDSRTDLQDHHYGLLGVSLGAGVAIVSQSRLSAIAAAVADSAPINQIAVVDRLDTLRLGPLSIPLAPIGPWAVDHLLGAPLDRFSPLRSVRCIAPARSSSSIAGTTRIRPPHQPML
jgi:uncharacterized protein